MILMDSKPPPDILALQETDTNGSIPGYDRFDTEQGTTGKNICTFVRRDLAVKKHTVSIDRPTKLSHRNSPQTQKATKSVHMQHVLQPERHICGMRGSFQSTQSTASR
ncbi:unnamed protein product [Ixodes pacificus]